MTRVTLWRLWYANGEPGEWRSGEALTPGIGESVERAEFVLSSALDAAMRERDEALAELEDQIARAAVARAQRDEAIRERDAYKQAKAENDERFSIERDEARAEVERLRAAIQAHRDIWNSDSSADPGTGQFVDADDRLWSVLSGGTTHE